MEKKMKHLMLVLIVVFVLVTACTPASTPPVPPQVGTLLSIDNAMKVKVSGYISLTQTDFLIAGTGSDFATESRTPATNNIFYAVTVNFMLTSNITKTMALNFSDISISDTAGKSWQPQALTFYGDSQNPSKLAFFNGIGKDGQTGLDFGLGFTGNDLSMVTNFPNGYLEQIHNRDLSSLTFLFEVPQENKVQSFKFLSLPAIILDPSITTIRPTVTSGEQVKILKVERVQSFGAPGAVAHASPGNVILLFSLDTKMDLLPFASDLTLIDDSGKKYPVMGLYELKYIFEVPENAKKLTLVVKGTIDVPVP
jgi:hypothetical protein